MNFLYLFLAAAAAALVITPLVILFAEKFQFLDFPQRSHPAVLHKEPTPRSGGLAIFFAIVVVFLLSAAIWGFSLIDKHISGILLAALVIVVVGVIDDKYCVFTAKTVEGYVPAN